MNENLYINVSLPFYYASFLIVFYHQWDNDRFLIKQGISQKRSQWIDRTFVLSIFRLENTSEILHLSAFQTLIVQKGTKLRLINSVHNTIKSFVM